MQKIDALILCGGQGKRLRKIVQDRQKCMLEFNGQPFLNSVINFLKKYKINRIILCAGYKASTVRKYYANKIKEIKIIFSKEQIPLGTAGAIKNAQRLIRSNPFLVLNGDSLCEVNLFDFLSFHKNKKALVSMVLVKAKDIKNIKDFGIVRLDKQGRIVRFCEKARRRGGFINAGIYLFKKEILSLIPKGRYCSLEYVLFPKLSNNLYGYIANGILLDIGTPRRYLQAKKILINKLDIR